MVGGGGVVLTYCWCSAVEMGMLLFHVCCFVFAVLCSSTDASTDDILFPVSFAFLGQVEHWKTQHKRDCKTFAKLGPLPKDATTR